MGFKHNKEQTSRNSGIFDAMSLTQSIASKDCSRSQWGPIPCSATLLSSCQASSLVSWQPWCQGKPSRWRGQHRECKMETGPIPLFYTLTLECNVSYHLCSAPGGGSGTPGHGYWAPLWWHRETEIQHHWLAGASLDRRGIRGWSKAIQQLLSHGLQALSTGDIPRGKGAWAGCLCALAFPSVQNCPLE